VWGLAAQLIKEDYDTNQIREASVQWLHFIRPDYYMAKAIEEAELEPEQFGFSTESSCYSGRCDTPFYTETSSGYLGGCAGMEELILVEAD